MNNFRKLIRELLKDVVDEISTSAGAGPYMTPNAFVGPKGRKPPRKGVNKKDHTPVPFGKQSTRDET